MSETIEVKVPDIGDFKDVEIIEVQVGPGDRIEAEDPMITLESDKATMEVPSPRAGVVERVLVKVGDRVSEGVAILSLKVEAAQGAAAEPAPETAPATAAAEQTTSPRAASARPAAKADVTAEVVVLGAGPGGYTAAFRAADLGKRTVLVERYAQLGGVCLNVGCIPSKALLHLAQIVNEARELDAHGVSFGAPRFELEKMREWKDQVIGRLTGGLAGLAKQRKVQVVRGYGRFVSAHEIEVEGADGKQLIAFEQAIIAAGSHAARIPGLPEDPRIFDSTGALRLEDIPSRLLVVGGGIIGLEMATVYEALGSRVSVVELSPTLMPGCDPDLVKPLRERLAKRYEAILLNTGVERIEAQKSGLKVSFGGEGAPSSERFDRVLVAVGRRPNGALIGAENAGVKVDAQGFIPVDRQMRTSVPHIFAIGDIVGQPMLAHKATHEGKVAAEVAAGEKSAFDARAIPSVAYTDPEIAWAGLTETEAKAEGVEYEKAVFPWAASGRSLALGRSEGMTKLLFDKSSHRLLGAGIVGTNAGELIAEAVLALEMGAEAEDIGLSIHPHPTLSETLCFAAEVAAGTITDLPPPRKKGR